ncbi:HAD family hydrolase [Leucobacter manosquensis]|uniref:HAD family hydrolase n=1 Tax=Leucobacter manosquensis TaxID=2810611 RepID=A0ABS5M3B1_9MICO|nr:HAD family hydrolase [Leucobacter manosquensis]MBS3181503.1 HAD family hydrolase [Leucobacter manosquensis]
MAPSIVFDFDGTLAIGHGPVRAYAACVADGAAVEPRFIERVDAELARYDAGASSYRDGYDIVGSLAEAAGVSDGDRAAAYERSRTRLGSDLAVVDTIADLDSALERLGRSARLVLATNAPETGVAAVLDAWGVRDRFDELHYTVGKPVGLARLIERLIAEGPVLAIGDIFEFDLAPAAALGADTALVGATAATAPVSVTMRGRSLADLVPDLHTWAASAASSTSAPLGAGSGIER